MKNDFLDWLEIVTLGVSVLVLTAVGAMGATVVVYCLHTF
jgi:hypothetical protein